MPFLTNKIYRVKVRSGVPWETYWLFKPSKEQILKLLDYYFQATDKTLENLRQQIQTAMAANMFSIQEEEMVEEEIT